MKLKVFKFINSKENNKDKSTIFENILFVVCIVCFVVLVSVQIVLVIPSARDSLNLTDKSIGAPLSSDEYLYNQGQITLKMIGTDPDPTVRILVNGDNVAMFEKLEMNINVKDGDVIEIDGSQSLLDHIITVASASTNINSKCSTAVAKVETNIQRLVKVQIN
ncbi:MAG TPA: hypothetical protein VIK78_22715 [Ruminiclostridium sp.]